MTPDPVYCFEDDLLIDAHATMLRLLLSVAHSSPGRRMPVRPMRLELAA